MCDKKKCCKKGEVEGRKYTNLSFQAGKDTNVDEFINVNNNNELI